MDKSILRWQLAGFLFTSVLGTLLHFVFQWSGQLAAVAMVSPVNESIWEHMKLIYFPMLLFAWLQSRWMLAKFSGFWCYKLRGILIGMLLIPILYYTYTGMFGTSAEWFNILTFFLAAGAAYLWEARQLTQSTDCGLSQPVALLLIAGIGIAFVALTFFPPQIPLFQDPVTGTYGFQG